MATTDGNSQVNLFASEPAEKAYQSLLKTGVTCSRDQFREALKTFTMEQELSRKKYEKWRAEEDAKQKRGKE